VSVVVRVARKTKKDEGRRGRRTERSVTVVSGRELLPWRRGLKKEKKRVVRLHTSIPSNMTDPTGPSHRHSEPSMINFLAVKSLTRVLTRNAGEVLRDIQLRDRQIGCDSGDRMEEASTYDVRASQVTNPILSTVSTCSTYWGVARFVVKA
jgi:hypothetical protein